jgi:FtsZ-binding cell division protein ZapB
MFSSLDNLEYNVYAYPESAPRYATPQPTMVNYIEFTDLTAPQHDSRRRRRSGTAQDKEAVSNMRIVSAPPIRPRFPRDALPLRLMALRRTDVGPLQRRRAQNRASQRAFRERKEKHVQRLEQQLEELETKHRELTKSYTDLDSTHDQLKREAKQLRGELDLLKSSREQSLLGIMEPTLFDPFAADGLFEPRQGV